MKTEISYIVNNPIERKGDRVLIRYAGTENIIHRDEAQKLDSEALKVWLMLGLSKSKIQEICNFLRS